MNTRITLAACLLLAASAAYAEDQSAPVSGNKLDVKHGAEVYRSSCASCHDKGKDGAPRLNRPESWKNRSFESFSVLNNHASKGFLSMPPKGRRPVLKDQDIADAVFYITQRLEGGK